MLRNSSPQSLVAPRSLGKTLQLSWKKELDSITVEVLRRVNEIIQDEFANLQQRIELSTSQDLCPRSQPLSFDTEEKYTSRRHSGDFIDGPSQINGQTFAAPFTFESGPRVLIRPLMGHEGEMVETVGNDEAQHLLTEECEAQGTPPLNNNWEDTFATDYLQRQSNTHNGWLCCKMCAAFVQSENFELVSCAFIVANCFIIVLQVDYMTNHYKEELPFYLTVAKHFISIVFFTEVFLRAVIYQSTFLGYVSRNLVDSSAIVLTLVEEVGRLGGWDLFHTHILAGLGVLRLVRIFRVIRIIRKINLLVLFGQLRVLIVSITDSMGSLFWAFVAIGLVTFLVAVVLVSLVKYRLTNDRHVMEEDREALIEYFGSVEGAMLTLYEVALDGIHWSLPLHALLTSCPGFVSSIFVAYTTLSRIAVMNIVTSIFLTSAMKLAEADRKMILQTKMLSFFHDADTDKDGTISWAEFIEQAEHPIMVEFFEELDIDPRQARQVYDSLDIDKSGSVDIDELVKGMANIRNRILATGLMAASSSA